MINKKLLHSFWRGLMFFILTAFIVTCCTSLFLNTLSSRIGLTLTSENLSFAAKLTFGNVILLTVIFTLIDSIRRKLMVERPVKQISEAAKKIMQGDFSIQIPKIKGFMMDDNFNQIITYFNKMAKELSSIETLRSDFIANVSHEIKTPLTVIQNYATLLNQKDLSEEKRKEYAKATIEATGRLTDLITNILKLNKLENQQIFPEFEAYNLSKQLSECFLSFENLWEKKELVIQCDIDDDVFVKSDREMMSLVWNNLFSNAIKFTEKDGKIFVSLHATNDQAIVTIKDTGCGISKEVGAHIFDKFYQGDTSHAYQGNGLGLALVKRVIDITGCEISVSSEVGIGSTFTVKMQRCSDGKTKTNSF